MNEVFELGTMKLASNELQRISETLGGSLSAKNDREDNYYVYLLATEDKKPFYIGKGKGVRIFQHEANAEEIVKAIQETGEEVLSAIQSKKISEKIKTIIKAGGVVEKYIVKWGLTSQEAFMCESSLINMYNLVYPGQLTNIQNGHASEKEKGSAVHTTRAFSVEDFLKDVCIEEVCYEDTELIHHCIVFIQIKNTLKNYEEDKKEENFSDDDYIYQCAQGYWAFGMKRAEKAEYAVVLQNSIVRGVYPILKWMKLKDLRVEKDAPRYPIQDRKKDYEQSDEKVLKRIGFVKQEEEKLTSDRKEELQTIRRQIVNKIIKEKKPHKEKDWFKEQNSVYNYELIKGKAVIKQSL